MIEPNAVLGVPLPGPRGTHPLDRFSGVRVALRPGPIYPGAQGGSHELVWLVGTDGTPNIVLARTEDRAGRELGALLRLPVEETGAPREIRL